MSKCEWMRSVPCQGQTHLFYEDDVGKFENEKLAKAICQTCRFPSRCADYAMLDVNDGIWGGYRKRERFAVHRIATRNVAKLGSLLDRAVNGVAEDGKQETLRRLQGVLQPV